MKLIQRDLENSRRSWNKMILMKRPTENSSPVVPKKNLNQMMIFPQFRKEIKTP